MLRRNFDRCKDNKYKIQDWIDELADLDVTQSNIVKWANSVPIMPIEQIPHTPIFLYGKEAGINHCIINIMKSSFDKNPIKTKQNVKSLFSRLSNTNKKDMIKNRVKYNFCNEVFPETKVEFSNGLTTIRLEVLARNPREPKEV